MQYADCDQFRNSVSVQSPRETSKAWIRNKPYVKNRLQTISNFDLILRQTIKLFITSEIPDIFVQNLAIGE
jgi:hypothetical protein